MQFSRTRRNAESLTDDTAHKPLRHQLGHLELALREPFNQRGRSLVAHLAFGLHDAVAGGPHHRTHEALLINRLLQEVVGTVQNRPYGHVNVAVSGNKHDRDI